MSRKIAVGRTDGPHCPAVLTQDDHALFSEAMRGVAPLAGKQRVPLPPTLAKGPRRLPTLRASVASGAFADDININMEVQWVGQEVAGRGLDVNRKLLKQLRQGCPAPQATLDLHGRTAAVARDFLTRFVGNGVAAGKVCVLVVHGRGLHSESDGPVLKNVVVELLSSKSMAPFVLAFASAPRALGADGATLVRLRKAR